MTVENIYRTVAKKLNDKVDTPALDARILVEFVLGLSDSRFILDSNKEISSEDEASILSLAQKRLSGTPVAYLTNRRDFFGHVFYVEEGVLIPQPDTETLVEEALAFTASIKSQDLSVLDVCAGTGCIGLSLVYEVQNSFSNVELTLSDISEKAFSVFSKNSETILSSSKVKVNRYLGDMFEPVAGKKFSLIVSNPPYIKSSVIPSLPLDVQAEPLLALDGGLDGLDLVKVIATKARDYLKPGGALFIEIGFDQGKDCLELFKTNGWTDVKIIKDLANNDRVVRALF